MTDVWITYDVPPSCECWRDALCTHDWTWKGEETDFCEHFESYEPVHRSLADAIRSLYGINGRSAIGSLLRSRYKNGPGTHEVFVMPPISDPLVDDHEAAGGPTPLFVISRYSLQERSTPRTDIGSARKWAAEWRDA